MVLTIILFHGVYVDDGRYTIWAHLIFPEFRPRINIFLGVTDCRLKKTPVGILTRGVIKSGASSGCDRVNIMPVTQQERPGVRFGELK